MTKKNRSNEVSGDLREQAEHRLVDESVPPQGMSQEDLAAVVHELRVHQVELEMQNEALRQTQVDLEQSRTKYAELFDYAPVGYLVFEPIGHIVEANLTAAGMLHVPRPEVIGKAFTTFLQPPSRDTWRFHYQAVFKSGQPQECDVELKRRDKAMMVVHLRSQPVKDDADKVIQCRTSMTNITALTRTEHRLRESEHRFRTLTENSPDVIARFDRDMRLLYVNRSIETALGIPASDFVGRTLDEVGAPSDLINVWTREVEVVFATGKARQAEFSTSTSHGVRHYNAILVPEQEGDGTAGTVLATVRDVTDRVRAEERYRTIIANSQEGFAILDSEGRFIEVNDAYCAMIGCRREDVLGVSVIEKAIPEYREELRRHWETAIRQGYDRFQAQHQRDDGAVIEVDVSVQRIDGDNFFAFIRDITERRRAERERMESLLRLELVAEATHDGIWDWDLTTDTIWRSDAFAAMLGYAPDEVDNSKQWWRDRIHPEDRDAAITSVEEAQQNDQERWSKHYRIRRKDGSYAWVMDHGRVLRDEQGKVVRVVGAMTDLTERIEMLGELESERTKLATVLETVQSGIIVADAQGRPTYANPVIEAVHQRPIPIGEDLEAHAQMGLLHLDGTPYKPKELPLVRAAVNGETFENIEMLVERPDGTRRYILTNASPLRDSHGTIVGAVAALYDITEMKGTEQAMRKARDELEDRVRERTEELNTTVGTLQEEVAARYEAQDHLMRQNELLQTIVNHVPVMLCFYDAEGNVAIINEEVSRVLGYSLEDFRESGLAQVAGPDPQMRQQLQDHMMIPEALWRDFVVRTKDGQEIISSWSSVRLPDGSYVGIGIDIRERRQFEDRLRESEERYRTLVEMSPDAICVEREGTVVFANSTALKLLDAKRIRDVIGRPLLDFVHPEDREETVRQHAEVQARHAPLRSVEKRIVRRNGNSLHVEASAMPIVFEGKPATQVVMHDITDRKIAEKRLRESARQLQQQARLLDLAHDSIMVHDMDGKIIFWNRGAEQTYGWTREEASGKVGHELLQTRFPHNLVEISAKLLSEGRWDGELTHTTRDGRQIVVSSRWALQHDEDDQPTAILVIDRDITLQKQAERKTAEARRFAENIIDTVQDALLVLDAELRVVSANHTFYNTFLAPPEETVGRYVYEIDHRQWDIPELRTLLENILPHDTTFKNFEVEHDFKHIGHRTMLLNARRVFQETQEMEMILLAIQDITVRKEQEQEIVKSQRQLALLTEELLFAEERERHRLAVLLHDSIGQSLSFSKRELGVLEKHVPGAMDEIIEGIKEQIDVAIHQTRDLTFELSPTTLHTFGLEAAIEELGDQLSRRERFEFHFEATEEELPLPEQVKTFLYRAARELLTNVAKHAEAQNVYVRIDRVDDRVRIHIKDDGRGFDLAAVQDTTARRQGFGILSIRERLTYLGGSFHIASEPGKGTEATLIAPLKKK